MRATNKTPKHGFTFLEVMVALAIIAVALVSVISAQSQSMLLVDRGRELNVVTELARAKMAELELDFSKKGFGEIAEKGEGTFADPDLTNYRWTYEMTKLEIPGEAPSQSKGPVGFGYIKDFLSRSVRQLKLTIIWGSSSQPQSMSLVTFLANAKELPNLNLRSSSSGDSSSTSGGTKATPSQDEASEVAP